MRVLYFYPWGYFAPIRSGADNIAAGHLEYFRARGWEVDCILPRRPERDWQADPFARTYPWLRSVQLVELPGRGFSFRGAILEHQAIKQDAALARLLRKGADLFFSNYVFTAPLVEGLPRECKRLLEAHDIVTNAFAITEKDVSGCRDAMAPARDKFLYQIEIDLFRLFHGVMFINDEERRQVDVDIPGKTHYVPPMIGLGNATGEERAVPGRENYDLLFVGARHGPNQRGMSWFLDHVYLPHLRQRRVRLAIAGEIGASLPISDPCVHKLGPVEDLKELYQQSKVVIVPLLDGSGLSIKTIESLAMGRAIVTTPEGARGIPKDPEAFACVNMKADPPAAAQTILNLLRDEGTREAMKRAARGHFLKHFSRERYLAAMDAVMEALGFGPQLEKTLDAAKVELCHAYVPA